MVEDMAEDMVVDKRTVSYNQQNVMGVSCPLKSISASYRPYSGDFSRVRIPCCELQAHF